MISDSEIVQKLKNPDTKNYGFNLLIGKYNERIYWHIRRMVIDHDDTDDLLQEVFIKIHKSIDKFREESELFTWIYRIATNLSINHLNSKKKRFFLPIHDIREELISTLNSSVLVTEDTIEKKLYKALLNLPEKQRIVFNMKYFEDLKYEEISKITGTSVGALKASYHHAVKKIEELLNTD